MRIRLAGYLIKTSIVVALLLLAGTILAQEGQGTNEKTLIYGLVVDNSHSLRSELPKVTEIAKLIINNNLSDDETFIVRRSKKSKRVSLLMSQEINQSCWLA